MDEIGRRKGVIERGETDLARWTATEAPERGWLLRAKCAAERIPKGARVLDLGCGTMQLEQHLPAGCIYIPCDLAARDHRTRVCDFNKGELPAEIEAADRLAALGVFEYIYDVPRFLRSLASTGVTTVATYCPTDYSAHLDRGALGWVNTYSAAEIRALFIAAGFRNESEERIDGLQLMFVLGRAAAAPASRNVVVLSYGNVGNFGDRLGYHLINGLVPSNGIVWHVYHQPWRSVQGEIDLLVLGLGNSLFGALLTPDLENLIRRAKRKIGIFGTQYREEFAADDMKRVVSSLDCWFARYEEDLFLYGNHAGSAVHLGDWLIDAFAMAQPQDDRLLRIDDDIWKDLPLDRVIQKIQQHRSVHSGRLHPLLCALTSAERVAYVEQRESVGGGVSGKFRSMLVDVFGRTFPENNFWIVDRDAVRAYKVKVRRNVRKLETKMLEYLAEQ
jgi:hypothetical protein